MKIDQEWPREQATEHTGIREAQNEDDRSIISKDKTHQIREMSDQYEQQ